MAEKKDDKKVFVAGAGAALLASIDELEAVIANAEEAAEWLRTHKTAVEGTPKFVREMLNLAHFKGFPVAGGSFMPDASGGIPNPPYLAEPAYAARMFGLDESSFHEVTGAAWDACIVYGEDEPRMQIAVCRDEGWETVADAPLVEVRLALAVGPIDE